MTLLPDIATNFFQDLDISQQKQNFEGEQQELPSVEMIILVMGFQMKQHLTALQK